MNANLDNTKEQKPSKIGLANIITFCRVLLALTVFGLLLGFPSDKEFLQLSFFLTLLVIIGDMLDGFVARKFEESSKFGAWFDIAADRLVEICYWVVFASLGWISAWIAIIFVCRGVLVDGIRSFALAEGFTAFGSETMMKSG
ncbi:MAG TPA: CDP-alcohol phosphatidyltransferase family protein, partial [Vampirovibrionales bacterium]